MGPGGAGRVRRMTGAYPDEPVEIVRFCYESDLHLTRRIEAVRGRRGEDAEYALAQRYRAWVTVKAEGTGRVSRLRISIPAGFLTDLASVPRPARWAVSRVGPHLEASIVHDWLYVAWQFEGRERTARMRRFADDVFLAAMKRAKVCRFKCYLIYGAVRVGGWIAFNGTDDRLFVDA